MTKSIALLHYSCPPVVGGVEAIVEQQASLFNYYNHTVKILAGNGEAFTCEYKIDINPLLSSSNKEIIELQKYPETNQCQLEIITEIILGYLREQTQGHDILIAHNVLSMPFNLPLTKALHKLANYGEIQVIAWNHDSPYFYNDYSSDLDLPEWQILRKQNPNIQYVAISESRKEEFASLYGTGDRIAVIPNGIDPIRFLGLDSATARLIREESLFMSDLVILQPSRLHPRKNIELSIHVLKALTDCNINVKMLLTGAIDPHNADLLNYRHKLLALSEQLSVPDRLIVLTEYYFNDGERFNTDRANIRDLYLISDLLFMPSKQEGFGIPLLEASLLKLPVVCSEIVPFKDIAGENAFYFSLDDSPEKIATGILTYLKQMRHQGLYRKVLHHYLWKDIYNQYIKPYLKKL